MSLRPLTRFVVTSEPCVLCRSRQLLSPARYPPQSHPPHLRHDRRNATSYQWRRNYAQQVRGSWKEVRDEIDSKRRKGFYQLMEMQGLISLKMQDAEDVYQAFVTNQSIMDSKDLILWLAETYKVPLRTLTYLAVITHRIPEAVDKTGRAPPSQHKPVGKEMLLGCCEAGDLLATLHILGAVLNSESLEAGRELATSFNEAELSACLKMAGELADKGHPAALVVRGLFLEQEGKVSQARGLYEAAMEPREDLYHSEDGKLEAAKLIIPTVPPWIPLATLLMQSGDASSREQAKKVLERGALEEDDPLAYYHLASFEGKQSADWLTYMTKAAGSGYAEAMYELGIFYQKAGDWRGSNNGLNPSILADTRLAKALNWLQEWRRKGPDDLAVEWFEAAATRGHKPAMAELVKIYETGGNVDKVVELSEELAKTPTSKQELKKWSMLTRNASQRLSSARLEAKMKGKR
ncbi:hypothetical protein BDV96DRAFT_589906 [Lophiotrema nucula]|uniref:HCP-like protein n=1 Tax=Lophiotrema nucula TaxID=690887 RepID=A0A6A5YIY3_9PLEO|nr:hypothetical protein BDV96DRAFT_589906 [Lophiotrema nucula]